MIDHNLVTMTQISKQQKQQDEDKQKKQLQRKDAVLMSAYSTRYVDDMIEMNENEIDSLKQKIHQTMNNFDEKIHVLQKKNEINIAENFKDIIFSLSHELDKMTKLVDSLTHGQGVTTQAQLKLSIQLVREYKEEYQKVYDAFLKVSRENKQWNIKVHTLRDRVRELEEQVNRQEQYLDFFKKKYNINIDNELAKLQQIEKEKNITLMEDIKVYLNKNNGKDNEPSAYQKFIKNFIFDKYTFTILDLFLETDKMIYNLKKQYQFSASSGEKTTTHQHRSKMISQFREQRAENYYYQLFVKCVNDLNNSQPSYEDIQKQEQVNSIIQQISSKNTMMNIQPEDLLKLFLSDNNVQQLIRKHVFYRQSQIHQSLNQNNHIVKENNNKVNQNNNIFLSINTPNSTINNNQGNITKYIDNSNNHSMDEIQQPHTTNTTRHKYQNRRSNLDQYKENIKRISVMSKPESPVVSKDRSFLGSGSNLQTPVQTPTLMNRVRVSSELGNRELYQQFKTHAQMKAKTPQHQQNNLSINTQDESFDINQNGQPSTALGSALNSSRQQQSSIKQNSIREIEVLNNYLNSLNPRWKHNPTSNEKLKSQNRFFQTQIQRYSPVKQHYNNNN